MRTSKIIACLILSCCVHSLKAQDTISQNVMNKASIQLITDTTFHSQVDKYMIYITTVKLISDPSFTCYGALYEVNDSSLSFSSHRVKDYYSRNLELTKLPVENYNFNWTQQPGSDRRGAWIEADFGAAIRALMEVLSEDDF
jgi:hypothetical protein